MIPITPMTRGRWKCYAYDPILLIIIFFYISYLWIFFVMVTLSSAHAIFSSDWNRMSRHSWRYTQRPFISLSNLFYFTLDPWLTRVWLRFSLTFPTLIHAGIKHWYSSMLCMSINTLFSYHSYVYSLLLLSPSSLYYYYYYYYYYLIIHFHHFSIDE